MCSTILTFIINEILLRDDWSAVIGWIDVLKSLLMEVEYILLVRPSAVSKEKQFYSQVTFLTIQQMFNFKSCSISNSFFKGILLILFFLNEYLHRSIFHPISDEILNKSEAESQRKVSLIKSSNENHRFQKCEKSFSINLILPFTNITTSGSLFWINPLSSHFEA